MKRKSVQAVECAIFSMAHTKTLPGPDEIKISASEFYGRIVEVKLK
jgi:hypothetical protein